jgi:MoaA/NifB/PqqE/SkfB family radical SAM enzyme
MKKIIRIQQPDDAPMHLTWMINNICQNSCSYCPPNLHDGANHYYEWENAKRFFEMLFEKYPRIHCSVSGGEPSMSPFFKDICKTFYEKGHSIGLTSNAAKSVDYWREISPYLNYISFSWHSEFPDKNFIEKVTAASLETLVTVRIMMLPSKWKECVEMFEKISNIMSIIVEPVKILEYDNIDPASYAYTDEQSEWFNNNHGNQQLFRTTRQDYFPKRIEPADIYATYHFDDGESIYRANASDYVNKGMTNFNGYTCEIGLRSLFVRPNGIIYLGNCLVGGKIGNINQPEKIKWPTESVKCNIDLCHCSSDVNITKWID